MEREPGTILRDRYVLTAPFDDDGAVDVWRAVDMVLRRRVVVIFDPMDRGAAGTAEPATPDEPDSGATAGTDEMHGAADIDDETDTGATAGTDETHGAADIDDGPDTGATAGTDETHGAADIDDEPDGHGAAEDRDSPAEPDAAERAHALDAGGETLPTAPPPGVPVGELLDGGNVDGWFYRVFRLATDPDTSTAGALAGAAEEDVTLALPASRPLFAGDAIDGADATHPMGLPPGTFQPPPLDAVPLPADPTTELPRGPLGAGAGVAATTGETESWPEALPPPDPSEPWRPAFGPVLLAPPPQAAMSASEAERRRRRARSGPARHGPSPRRQRRSFPTSLAAVIASVGAGLTGFLIGRPPPSVSSPPATPPLAVGATLPATTTTVEQTTTTETTLPETTTTTVPTTRPTTTPPPTDPPETEPSTTSTRRTTTTRRPLPSRTTTTTIDPNRPIRLSGDD